jgi:hypothetical protein
MMNRVVVALALLALALLAPALAIAGSAPGAERRVIIPRDKKPFTVGQNEIVRLTGKGIAGSRIEAKVQGPAKIEGTSRVSEVVGGRALLGNNITEFEIRPTGTGKVKVQITVTPPQPDEKPIVTDYELAVR